MQDRSTQDEEIPEVSEYAVAFRSLYEDLGAQMVKTEMAQAEQDNKKRHPDPMMKPGDQIWMWRKNIWTTQPSNKLDCKQIGLYTILEKIGSLAYKLGLPPTAKIHPVFHTSLHEPTTSTEPIPGDNQPPPLPIIIQEQQEWEVEKILDS